MNSWKQTIWGPHGTTNYPSILHLHSPQGNWIPTEIICTYYKATITRGFHCILIFSGIFIIYFPPPRSWRVTDLPYCALNEVVIYLYIFHHTGKSTGYVEGGVGAWIEDEVQVGAKGVLGVGEPSCYSPPVTVTFWYLLIYNSGTVLALIEMLNSSPLSNTSSSRTHYYITHYRVPLTFQTGIPV